LVEAVTLVEPIRLVEEAMLVEPIRLVEAVTLTLALIRLATSLEVGYQRCKSADGSSAAP
jgi:hypothetical protein